jgi:hypothetical protein
MTTMSEAFRRCLEAREREMAASDPTVRHARRLARQGDLRVEYAIRPNGICVQTVFLPGGWCMYQRFVEWVRE